MSEEMKIDGRTREGRMVRAAGLNALPDMASATDLPPDYEGSVMRATRKPFGSVSQKLAYPPREGYHRHWFNDTPGRVDQAKGAGYVHVKDPATGQNIRRVVGVTAQGAALDAYLMEIPKEWWDSDMAEYAKLADEKEEAIRRGQVEAISAKDRDNFRPVAQGRKIDIRNNVSTRR